MKDLKEASLYINRELSWVRFNSRVLFQAKNDKLPLLERLKFLAIYSNNLDEFYMIRVAGLKRLFKDGINSSGADRLTPIEQLTEIRKYLVGELKECDSIFNDIMHSLKKEGIYVEKYSHLDKSEKQFVTKYFFENLYQVIIPIAVDTTHPFPRLNNLSFGLVLKLKDKDNESLTKYGLIRIPRFLPRFIEISSGKYIIIEDLISQNITSLFPNYILISEVAFRVTRNADIELEEEEADDFLEVMEEGLRLRNKGEIVRLDMGISKDKDLYDFFNKHIEIDEDDIYIHNGLLNYSSLFDIAGNKKFAHLCEETFKPKNLPPVDGNYDIFDVLDKQDLLLYHPYDSFDPIVQLIQSGAKDKDVIAIKIVIYRSGNNSPIIQALIKAAENGKQVTAIVELKARFDEENNLVWAKTLERAGAHVVYGVRGFKVHAKALLITKRVGNVVKQYAQIGTGNYNPTTAKLYTDVSYLTSNKDTTYDLTRFFHFLTGFSKRGKLNKLLMSPTQIKPKIFSLISQEMQKGKDGLIIVKLNSLVDKDIIKALYRASCEGVKIELIVRGICSLKPGIKGVSENIRVKSVVGKYLEHSRVFYFKHASPSTYISSADWMPRNLVRRIELLCAIEDKSIEKKILGILQLQLDDNEKSFYLDRHGDYNGCVIEDGESVINSQKLFEIHANKVYKSIKKDIPSYVEKLTNKLFKDT